MLTEDQLKQRLAGIGGSEISAIIGQNPYAGPIDVYRAKVEGYRFEGNHNTERGNFFEPAVANWYAHRLNVQLREVGTVFNPKRKIVFCTPDRLAKFPDDEIDLSIKVPGPYVLEQWGEPGTDEAPPHALIQVQWELITLEELYGITRADIAAPIDGDLAVYHVLADRELQAMLIQEAEKFWRDCIEAKRPPEPDGSESFSKWTKTRFPKEVAPIIDADTEAEHWLRELKAAYDAEDEIEQKKKTARQRLELIIGEHAGLQGTCGRISWRRSKDSTKVDFEAVCRELNPPETLLQKYTRVKPGPRVFKPSWSKTNE
jgi:putative phage-type endonuclease